MKAASRRGRTAVIGRHRLALLVAAALVLPAAGCATGGAMPTIASIGQTTQHGYVISQDAIDQVPVGSSRDQVLIALGSPSTTGNFSGEVFYYISQTRHQAAKFLPSKVVDQRVLAVYFDQKSKVDHIANYGLKDGKLFDFIGRVTPTGGIDENFLQQVLKGVVGFGGTGPLSSH
jgi:outer membrane protein assembly factor BamE (lipoprotein component of BamABCDE complex)